MILHDVVVSVGTTNTKQGHRGEALYRNSVFINLKVIVTWLSF